MISDKNRASNLYQITKWLRHFVILKPYWIWFSISKSVATLLEIGITQESG